MKVCVLGPQDAETVAAAPAEPDVVDVCLLPATKGEITCSGVFFRWTYNAKTETCEKISYGGCFGTENLFKNEFACLAKCNTKGKAHQLSI